MTTSFQVQNKQQPGYGHGKVLLLTQYEKPNRMVRQLIVRENSLSETLAVWDTNSWTIEEIDDPDINTV